MRGFSGSYDPRDVTFLLEPIDLAPIDVETKERLIQSGARHYSEMIGREDPPNDAYRAAFDAAFARNRRRYAADLLALADLVDAARSTAPERVIVSLARAGTPIGVSLGRVLRRRGRAVAHYSISIIRDRGIDEEALRYILGRHAPESLVFVDGWTAKGVIQRELEKSIARFPIAVSPELFVVADLGGTAAHAATGDDYVLPSAILNATISGLVSRSILSDAHHRPGDFHGCLHLTELAPFDRSRAFVDDVDRDLLETPARTSAPATDAATRRTRCLAFIERVRRDFGVTDENHIKPGIAEATRVMLRRVPELLMVRDTSDADVRHLLLLAEERAVEVLVDPELPFTAAALIRKLGGGNSTSGKASVATAR